MVLSEQSTLLRLAFALLLLFVVAPSTTSAIASGQSPQILKEGDILRGQFQQERRLAGLAKPLVTKGSFLLVPGRGLIWRSLTPFQNTVVISPGGLLAIADGKESMRLDASRMPGLGRLYEVLSGAVSGNLDALQQAFTVTRTNTATGWRLELAPNKSAGMAESQIRSLTVTGRRFVDSIVISKEGDDSDVLTFVDQVSSTSTPTSDELTLLQTLRK
jgi:hypothetical protein